MEQIETQKRKGDEKRRKKNAKTLELKGPSSRLGEVWPGSLTLPFIVPQIFIEHLQVPGPV